MLIVVRRHSGRGDAEQCAHSSDGGLRATGRAYRTSAAPCSLVAHTDHRAGRRHLLQVRLADECRTTERSTGSSEVRARACVCEKSETRRDDRRQDKCTSETGQGCGQFEPLKGMRVVEERWWLTHGAGFKLGRAFGSEVDQTEKGTERD